MKLDGGMSERRAGCLEQAVDSGIDLCKPNRLDRSASECGGECIDDEPHLGKFLRASLTRRLGHHSPCLPRTSRRALVLLENNC